MQGSKERVRRLLNGEKPDRAILCDYISNDAIYRHFNGGVNVRDNDKLEALRLIGEIMDCSRYYQFAPNSESVSVVNGRKVETKRSRKNNLTYLATILRTYEIVPLAMKIISRDGNGGKILVRNFNAARIWASI